LGGSMVFVSARWMPCFPWVSKYGSLQPFLLNVGMGWILDQTTTWYSLAESEKFFNYLSLKPTKIGKIKKYLKVVCLQFFVHAQAPFRLTFLHVTFLLYTCISHLEQIIHDIFFVLTYIYYLVILFVNFTT
jgi:hypothetical protein